MSACWVAVGFARVAPGGPLEQIPVEIFDNHKAAIASGQTICECDYASAVGIIRQAVFVRDDFQCTHCGAHLTWEKDNKGEMHEQLWRGRGGNISLVNSRLLCNTCHQNDPVAGHGDRKPQWSKSALSA